MNSINIINMTTMRFLRGLKKGKQVFHVVLDIHRELFKIEGSEENAVLPH